MESTVSPVGAAIGFWMFLKLVSFLGIAVAVIYALYCLSRIAAQIERLADAQERANQVGATPMAVPAVAAPPIPGVTSPPPLPSMAPAPMPQPVVPPPAPAPPPPPPMPRTTMPGAPPPVDSNGVSAPEENTERPSDDV